VTSIFPIPQTFKLVDDQGYATVEFKRFLDQLLARAGGVSGGTYAQLPDAASIVWDLEQKPVAVLVLGGNRTLTPTNLVAGLVYRLTVVQDATGNRLIAWGSAFKFPGGTAPTLSAAANAVDEFWFPCDGTNLKLMVGQFDLR
jgi:hypothetical protein